ncbi:hypothetical protein RFI_26963 [Reticulomyxa filosa]|uniref:NUC153 domain-containing protein n=1 Tax=Reticulomyxa filosa TaxID=46433 RepID=X6M970_RETFI|nr:hypothetical protein RFI_26963 [Reticulomyxa filosa]|eukprot:ETO10414.1 hypothetical protein RFI_26963 [Reticulomyxa filosa]
MYMYMYMYICVDNSIDTCTEAPEKYTPASDRATKCLGSTFVDLTWDKTDPNRVEIAKKAFTSDELLKMDLDAYLETDGDITDAGLETDFPVTEYDTDTPDKKVKVKRRARARYQDILSELKEKIETVKGITDDEQSEANENEDAQEGDEEEEGKKSSGDTSVPEEVAKLDEWIAKQKDYKQKEMMTIHEKNPNKKRSLSEMQEDGDEDEDEDKDENEDDENVENDKNAEDDEIVSVMTLSDECDDLDHYKDEDDSEPLISDDELPPEVTKDPYFQEESDQEQKDSHPRKRRKLNKDKTEEEDTEKAKREMRAKLEMLMMDNQKDPEDLEYDTKELEEKFNSRLKKDWRLRKMIKKAVKRKVEEMDNFEYDDKDNRFGALYEDPDFALDPTNPNFRRTRTMDTILEKTREKRGENLRLREKAGKPEDQDTDKLIQTLKEKTEPLSVLEDGNSKREKISEELKNKGLVHFQ